MESLGKRRFAGPSCGDGSFTWSGLDAGVYNPVYIGSGAPTRLSDLQDSFHRSGRLCGGGRVLV